MKSHGQIGGFEHQGAREDCQTCNPPTYPTPWKPFADGMEERRIGPNDTEVRFVSQEAAQRAIARLIEEGNVRACDHCGRVISSGALCHRCAKIDDVDPDRRIPRSQED